jgi:hypothetical protein
MATKRIDLTSDEQLRLRALELASNAGLKTEDIVKRAEKYHDFLIGKKDASK